jgi:hypothetical protein
MNRFYRKILAVNRFFAIAQGGVPISNEVLTMSDFNPEQFLIDILDSEVLVNYQNGDSSHYIDDDTLEIIYQYAKNHENEFEFDLVIFYEHLRHLSDKFTFNCINKALAYTFVDQFTYIQFPKLPEGTISEF